MIEDKIDAYNDFASEYSEKIVAQHESSADFSGILPSFLQVIGNISRQTVLDAGCGEGYLSRILVEQGAYVTGIDIAAQLIEIARAKDPEHKITYEVANLSQPQLAYRESFDLITSHLVLNDVFDYQGFLATLGTVAKPGGRLVLAFNNPYSYVVRNHINNYFDTGKAFPYRGMTKKGVKVHFYQRTLGQYIDACLAAGFQLQQLIDLPTPERMLNNQIVDKLLPQGYQFPYFMILSFVKA